MTVQLRRTTPIWTDSIVAVLPLSRGRQRFDSSRSTKGYLISLPLSDSDSFLLCSSDIGLFFLPRHDAEILSLCSFVKSLPFWDIDNHSLVSREADSYIREVRLDVSLKHLVITKA